MKKLFVIAMCICALSACGVRGDPVAPSKASTVVG